MSEITFTIDGVEVKAEKGVTVLEAAQKAGIRIPTLCAHPALEPYGACRLCIVEIEGLRGFPPSCTTPAAAGMVVKTKTSQIVDLRREVLKLLLSGHTSPCLVCLHREQCEKYRPVSAKAGKTTRCYTCSNRDQCTLRELAVEYNIQDLDLPIIYRNLPLERSDPFMDRDYNVCVLCGRCARICKKIHGSAVISFINRGKNSRIGTAFGRDHTESDCKFCGACIDICPTGSLSDRFAKWYGKPDEALETSCVICPIGCRMVAKIKDGNHVGSTMTDFTSESRLCAIGRFAVPQLLSGPRRLKSHKVRIADGLINTSRADAVRSASERLTNVIGDSFALVTHPQATAEEIYLLKKFTNEVMKSNNFIITGMAGEKVQLPTGVKALYMTGDLVDPMVLTGLKTIIIADMFPSSAQQSADVVIATAGLTETSGTFINAAGTISDLVAVTRPPTDLVPDWQIVCEIAEQMGAPGFNFASTKQIQAEMAQTGVKSSTSSILPEPSPLNDARALPRWYRGHLLSDLVVSLRALNPSAKPAAPATSTETTQSPFKILEKIEVVPNTHETMIYAPAIAEKCQPGQFIIAMVHEKSERIPYTVCDFDRVKGTITLVTLEAGRSSRELALTAKGDSLAHVAGPLGMPVEVKKYGTVVCAGGCYGVGAILPIARAMKEAGNRVICIEEASSHYLLHWQDRLSAVCDELIIVTKDGSAGIKGGIQEVLSMLVARGEKIDQSYIIGCTFMMMMVSNLAKELGIPTEVALNPIMLDGTGMCGACRVSLEGETKFACVDGPFFDGHKINWEELMSRNTSYQGVEIEALPQKGLKLAHACRCDKHRN